MPNWILSSFLSLFSFGLWGFFTKLAISQVNAKSALIYQTLGVVVVGFVALVLLDFKPDVNVKGISYGLLTGLTYGIGCLFYFLAADKGKMTTVVTLTALYPLVTILLSLLFLHETIHVKQFIGLILALAAIYFMC